MKESTVYVNNKVLHGLYCSYFDNSYWNTLC